METEISRDQHFNPIFKWNVVSNHIGGYEVFKNSPPEFRLKYISHLEPSYHFDNLIIIQLLNAVNDFDVPLKHLSHWGKYLESEIHACRKVRISNDGKTYYAIEFKFENGSHKRGMKKDVVGDLVHFGFAEILPGRFVFGVDWSCNFIMGEKVYRMTGRLPVSLSTALEIVAGKFGRDKLRATSCHSDLIDDKKLGDEDILKFSVPHFGRWIRVE